VRLLERLRTICSFSRLQDLVVNMMFIKQYYKHTVVFSVNTVITGWGGQPSDQPTKTKPAGMAHSLQDQRSSILIFTRKETSGAVVPN